MDKFEKMSQLANEIMETCISLVDQAVVSNYGSLENLASIDDETIGVIRVAKELMDKTTEYVRVSMAAFGQLANKVEENNELLKKIERRLDKE